LDVYPIRVIICLVVVATVHRCPLLFAIVRPPFFAASPPFCSLAHLLPITTPTAKEISGLVIVRAWSELVELWFLRQGFHDHLEKQEAEILEENIVPWLKLDYQLCIILWQSVSPELLEILRSFKTYYSFSTNARDVFANDVQRLFDST
ncbi:hypothetical protein CR513_59074, partial [Mucuna pruriens]